MLKAIKLLLLFFVTFLVLVFFSLFLGVKISSFSLGNISVSQFYIKLDKKLILTIENIILNNKETKSASTFEDIKKDIQFFPKILKYFKSIDIENLAFENNRFTIKLEDNYVYLDNKFINLATSFEHDLDKTNLNLYSLYLKEQDILLDGKIDIDYLSNEIKYKGNFFLEDIIGNLKIDANRKKIDFYADSNYFKNLQFLKPYLSDIDPIAKEWMYDNVSGLIKLDKFYGTYDFSKNSIDEKDFHGVATIDKAKIKFHKDVETVNTDKIELLYENGDLSFKLVNPKYKNIPIDGSSVYIKNLTSEKKGKVLVDIKANHILDKDIQAILRAFHINIPLIQKDGNTKAHVLLDIPYSYPMKTNGTFKLENANVSINDNFDFYSKNADIILDGSIVKVKNADFKHKDMIDANVNLEIDAKTLKAVGNANITSILIKSDNDEIINVIDTKSDLNLDFNGDVNIDLPTLDAYLSIDEFINIDLKDLSKLVIYSKLLQENSIENGNLFIVVKDFENLNFKGEVYGENLQLYLKNEFQSNGVKKLPLDGIIEDSITKLAVQNMFFENEDEIYDVKDGNVLINKDKLKFNALVENLNIPLKKNNELVKSLVINGELDDNSLTIKSEDKSIIYEKNNNKEHDNVYLNGYDVLVNTKEEKKNNKVSKYKIDAVNTNLVINDSYKFLAKKIDGTLDENIVLNLKYDNTEIRFEDVNKFNKIFAKNLSDYYLNTIFSKDIFSGGMMDVEITGKNYELDGKIKLVNSRIKDLAFINNLITFVNTSPALLNPLLALPSVINILNNEGFNLNGYRVNEGNVSFKYSPINNKVLVKELNTIGNSVDFEGSGIIDLKTDTLDMNMHLIFLKGYSNIVKYVPVVNYLFLGKNNRIDTNVKIVGKIADPQVETNFIKEGLSAPLDFGKRILNTPMNLLESIIGNDEEENK